VTPRQPPEKVGANSSAPNCTVRAQDQGVSGLPLNPLNLRGFFHFEPHDPNAHFYRSLTDLLPPGGTLLDLACGDGEFLRAALEAGAKTAEGVEISQSGVLACVQPAFPCTTATSPKGLTTYPDDSFDCVSLIRTLELFEKPEPVLDEMLRVGRSALITFTNFAHWNQGTRRWTTGILPGTEDNRLGRSPRPLSRLPTSSDYCGLDRHPHRTHRARSPASTSSSQICPSLVRRRDRGGA
jgi:methionine biosynthesis protein MetW